MAKTYRPKKSTYRRRKRMYRRKRRTTGAKIARQMQNKALSYVKKKYTSVTPIRVTGTSNLSQLTISHVGGINTNVPSSLATVTLYDTNPDGMLFSDMALYQYFKITGVSFKLFFPEGTDPNNTPVQWAMGYSSNLIIRPDIEFARLQSLQNYQTSSCDSSKPISRYFKTAGTLKRLGIDWCPTSEIQRFSGGDAIDPPPTDPPYYNQQPLYGGQLLANSGSSTNIKVYRAANATASGEIGRLQVTYYVQYKGTKGVNPLI